MKQPEGAVDPDNATWHPAPVIPLSAAIHVAALAGVVATPSLWLPALGAVVVNHLLIAGAVMTPRSSWLGPNLTRLTGAAQERGDVALTIDDGPDPDVTPRVLDLLDTAGAHASFFCIGERARHHPALVREIVARGHTVENHTQHHRNHFAVLGARAMRREISDAQACLADAAGRAPVYFRAVAGFRNPLLDPLLYDLDLRLVTWTRRAFDTRRRDPNRVRRSLLRNLAAGDILDLHDGNAARSIKGQPMILEYLPGLLAAITAAGLRPSSLPGREERRHR
jgi:peptidoglycan/xylan/chitin deacetylase (PgdA/CDA1 family)